MNSLIFKDTENPYLKNFREPKHHSKPREGIKIKLEILHQSLGTEIEMIQYWFPKTSKELDSIDTFILIAEKLLIERTVKHLVMLSEATASKLFDEIDFWNKEYLKLRNP